MIPFGEWLPDVADLGKSGSSIAKNCSPTVEGFEEFRQLSTATSALDSFCRGAFAAQDKNKNSYNYAGSGTKLYQLSDSTWTDQSKASGTYAVSDGHSWEFAKWGEKVICVGGINAGTPVPPQIISMGAVGSTEFADLGGSPPQAMHLAIVRNFVVMGNLYESADYYPNRIRWSGINDETEWTTNPSKQSDYQDLENNGGLVNSISGGSYGVIIQERSVQRMDYIGPPLVFSLTETLPGIGTRASNSVVQYGDTIFFMENGGLRAISGGQTLHEIGKGRVDKWIFSQLDESAINRFVGVLDRASRRIIWVFPGRGNAAGLPNIGLIYSIESGKFSYFEDEIEWVFDSFGEDHTLEQLDSISASIDTLGWSLDSTKWVGGAIGLSGFDPAHKSGEFNGDPMEATIDTREELISGPRRTLIQRVRPEIDTVGTSVTVVPGYRDALKDAVVWGADSSVARDGAHPMRVDARFHRFRVKIAGGFKKALGVEIVEGLPSSYY